MSVNRNAIEAAREAFNSGDLDGYLEIYDEDVVAHGYAPGPLDHAGVSSFYREIAAGLADARLDFPDVLEEGDRLAVRFSLTATHSGPLLGIPATGRSIALQGITLLRFRDGRVVERWQSADMLGLLTQLGAFPAPREAGEATVAART